MKKASLILITALVLVGCGNGEEVIEDVDSTIKTEQVVSNESVMPVEEVNEMVEEVIVEDYGGLIEGVSFDDAGKNVTILLNNETSEAVKDSTYMVLLGEDIQENGGVPEGVPEGEDFTSEDIISVSNSYNELQESFEEYAKVIEDIYETAGYSGYTYTVSMVNEDRSFEELGTYQDKNFTKVYEQKMRGKTTE